VKNMPSSISPSRVWRKRSSRYALEATKCKKCNAIHYPPRIVCDKCGSRELEKFKLDGTGVLESYTITYNVPEGFRDHSPLIFGIVKVNSNVRVLAQITDVEPSELKVGMPLEPVLRKVEEDGDTGMIKYGLSLGL